MHSWSKSLLLSLPLVSSFAHAGGFVIDVKHKCISTIAVERNVVTIFQYADRDSQFSLGAGELAIFILSEHKDHAKLDHHGREDPHTHLAFTELERVGPHLLNDVLTEEGFDPEERDRVVKAYTAYFTNPPEREERRRLLPDEHFVPLEGTALHDLVMTLAASLESFHSDLR